MVSISWRSEESEEARCQKAFDGIYIMKKWRAETQHSDLEFDSFQPRLKSGIFEYISLLNGLCFEGHDQLLSENGESRPIK